MNNATKTNPLPSLIGGVLSDKTQYIDNLFADIWGKLNITKKIASARFTKRSGIPISEAVFVLLLWKWLNVTSIAMFSRKAMSFFSGAKKDVMYDLLKREDVNWREPLCVNLQIAKSLFKHEKIRLANY